MTHIGKKYFSLGCAILGVALLFFCVGAIANIPLFEKMRESNRKYGVDAGTLFYTETEQFNSADRYMQNSRVAIKNSSKPDSLNRSK